MSDTPEPLPPVDLSDLRMTPKWVADFGNAQPQFHAHEGESQDRPRRDRGGRGGDERRGFGGGRGGPPRGGRFPGGADRGRREGGRREGGRREGGPPREGRRGDARDRGGHDRDQDRGPRFEAPAPIQGLTVSIEPDAKAVEAMAHMIRTAGKAYSVFEAAKLVLSSGDRFEVVFTLDAAGSPKFVTVPADSSVWLTREEAISHLVQSDALAQFYRAEEIELEEPKGIFTSVAICGFCGEILGPPNHHSYQTSLHRLHRERFAHIPFEDFKRRVRTDSSPEAVEKWKESQKHGAQWVILKAEVPEGGDAPRLKSRTEVETHFRTHYADSLLGETARATVPGNIPKKNLPPALYLALRRAVDEARKHLLGIAQQLCAGFEKQGLKLFKRRGGKLWVSRTRPRLLEHDIVLSDRVSRIIELVKAKPGIQMKELLETIAPAGAEKPAVSPSEPAQSASPPDSTAGEPAAAPDAGATSTPEPASVPSPKPVESERLHVLQDLHWLNSEGYLIEYSDGAVFIGVIEPPPAKPKAAKPAAPGEGASAEQPADEADADRGVAPAADEPAPEESAPETSKADTAPAPTPTTAVAGKAAESFPRPEGED